VNGAAFAIALGVSISFGTPAPSKVRPYGGFAAASAPPERVTIFPPSEQSTNLQQLESAPSVPTMRIHRGPAAPAAAPSLIHVKRRDT
jgi:hypothetical protein